jgi:hypothetical protein
MSDIPTESLHESIQRALNAGDFETVRELSHTLGQAIIREAWTISPGERTLFVEKGLSRLRDHLSLAHVLRAHVASQLRANTTVSLYQQSSGRGHSWRFEA